MNQIIRKVKILILIVCCISSVCATAGSLSLNGRTMKSKSILKQANAFYETNNFAKAASNYEELLKNDQGYEKQIVIKLADCYWQMRQYEDARAVYERIISFNKELLTSKDKYRIGELYSRAGKYSEAAVWFKDLPEYRYKYEHYSNEKAIQQMKKDSSDWKVSLININSEFREFSPVVSDSMLYFNSNKPFKKRRKASGWDRSIYTHLWSVPISEIAIHTDSIKGINSLNKTGSHSTQTIADIYEGSDNRSKIDEIYKTKINTWLKSKGDTKGYLVEGLEKMKYNVGSIAIDSSSHIYFSSNYDKPNKNGKNLIRLMEGKLVNNKIKSIKELPFGDKNTYSVMHPAVNKQGTIIVFSSDKPNGKGGYDLYYATREGVDKPWSKAVLLDENINSSGNEVFPTISLDNFLYFSSDGISGLGGLDIFKISLEEAINAKAKPKHISFPINTSADDFGLHQQDSSGKKGFLTSDRNGNQDDVFIFSYTIKKLFRKPKFEGLVLDKKTLVPLYNATVFMYNKSEDIVYIAKTDEKGMYHFPINKSSDIQIKAMKKNYMNDCLDGKLRYDESSPDTIQKAATYLGLDKNKEDIIWRTNNIHYDFDKYNIRRDAAKILDSLVILLKAHPVDVELGSHTDSRGSFKYNQILSEKRAKAAVAYLVNHGIDKNLITAKGYGEYQLLNKCSDGVKCSKKAHQENRRTEVRIVKSLKFSNKTEIDLDSFKDGTVCSKASLPINFFEDCEMVKSK